VTTPPRAILSEGQIATLAAVGEERTAAVGDVLFRVGDLRYPFIAIIEGEAAILDGHGTEIIRHGASRFLGEINLLSGQTVYLTAVVTKPMRYIAVDRDVLRTLLFDDAPLADLLLSTFMARREALQQRDGIGIEVVGPRSSEQTRRIVEFARRNRTTPHTPMTLRSQHASRGSIPASCRWSCCRAGRSCAAHRVVSFPVPSESGSSCRRVRRSTSSSSVAGPRGSVRPSTGLQRVSRRSSSRAARSVARLARRGGSRTISASPRASVAPS
jgi:CRP-like cAMP-binding protein